MKNDEFLYFFPLSYHSDDNDIGTAEARREKKPAQFKRDDLNERRACFNFWFFFLFAKRRKQRKEFSEDFVVKRSEGANQ